jgi:hypothetical protein
MVDGFSRDEMYNHRASILNSMFVTMVHMINYAMPKGDHGHRDMSRLVMESSPQYVEKILKADSKWEKEDYRLQLKIIH